MWRCEKCNRRFKSKNQWHSCTDIDMGELFIGKPDELVLAFDKLTTLVADWKPNEVATATKSIVFTSTKAWLIVKPMKSVLDVNSITKMNWSPNDFLNAPNGERNTLTILDFSKKMKSMRRF